MRRPSAVYAAKAGGEKAAAGCRSPKPRGNFVGLPERRLAGKGGQGIAPCCLPKAKRREAGSSRRFALR
jgi:hypothetical protein